VRNDGSTVLPLLVPAEDDWSRVDLVRDEFLADLAVAYSFGPPYGRRFVGRADLERLDLTRRELFRIAARNLRTALRRVKLHGQPPALMLSFHGLESSALLEPELWEDLRGTVPGELVVGVPARDVVIVTGSWSQQGMEKARRAVDRIFFAGDQHLLSRDLLVWRRRAWEVLPPQVPSPDSRRPSAPPR
jgi:uncharacterized protein YtpQ (UPF0354 family)